MEINKPLIYQSNVIDEIIEFLKKVKLLDQLVHIV